MTTRAKGGANDSPGEGTLYICYKFVTPPSSREVH